MNIKLLIIGKTKDQSIQKLTEKYVARLQRYNHFEIEVIPELKSRKNLSVKEQKEWESEEIQKRIKPADEVVLLDENGTESTSVNFAKWIQKKLNSGKKQLVFVIGGPYGFSEDLYAIYPKKIALSKMTFSHEMIRPFFAEQVYRAFTLLRNEPYHHQ